MPLSYRLREGLLCFETVGDVDFEEGLAVLREGIGAYRAQQPERPLLQFDLRRSTERRSNEEIRAIAERLAAELEDGRLALLVDRPVYYGLSRMFAAYTGLHGFEAEVFTDPDEALAWLRGESLD